MGQAPEGEWCRRGLWWVGYVPEEVPGGSRGTILIADGARCNYMDRSKEKAMEIGMAVN